MRRINIRQEREVLVTLQLIKIAHTLLVGKTIHVYTRYSTLEWVFTSKSLYVRAVSFAVLLSPYHLKVERFSECDVEFLQLLQASITPTVGLDELLSHIAPCSNYGTVIRLDTELYYAQVPTESSGFNTFLALSSKTAENGKFKVVVDVVDAS